MTDDVMQQAWCCLTCSSRFAFGKLLTKLGSADLHCPVCKSTNTHPADGGVYLLSENHVGGETRQ